MIPNPYESPSTNAETQPQVSSHKPAWFARAMAFSAAIATLLTLPLVGWAADEPFFGDFNLTDALIMLVGGGAGTIFWCLWSLAIVYAVLRRWWTPSMLLLILLALPIGYLNYFVYTGYLGDRQHWAEMQLQP